ncbi:MAG TPA: hypothetical protein VIS76_12585 [Pseudomonadales bacterium]
MRSMIALALLIWAGTVRGEDPIAWGVSIQQDYRLVPDVTYLVADGYESKLDVVAGRDSAVLRPTLLYIHGGGHGGFSLEQNLAATDVVRAFLTEHGILDTET